MSSSRRASHRSTAAAPARSHRHDSVADRAMQGVLVRVECSRARWRVLSGVVLARLQSPALSTRWKHEWKRAARESGRQSGPVRDSHGCAVEGRRHADARLRRRAGWRRSCPTSPRPGPAGRGRARCLREAGRRLPGRGQRLGSPPGRRGPPVLSPGALRRAPAGRRPGRRGSSCGRREARARAREGHGRAARAPRPAGDARRVGEDCEASAADSGRSARRLASGQLAAGRRRECVPARPTASPKAFGTSDDNDGPRSALSVAPVLSTYRRRREAARTEARPALPSGCSAGRRR